MIQPLEPNMIANDEKPSQEALGHIWLSGKNATDHNLLPELAAHRRRARLRRAVEIIKLQNRIQKLKEHEEDPADSDMGDAASTTSSAGAGENKGDGSRLRVLGEFAVLEAKQKQESLQVEEELEKESRRRSLGNA